MSATFRQIAGELVAALAGATFSIAISPTLTRLPEEDLKNLSTLTVSVVRQALATEPGDRAGDQADYRLNVVIQKKINRRAAEATAIDPLEDLAEEILDFISGTELPTAGFPVRCEQDPVYDPELLREKSVFLSVITPTYQALRTQP